MASNATFALKAAEWLRRGLLTVCSPLTGEIFAQLSKAVTFYPSVRICETTSGIVKLQFEDMLRKTNQSLKIK